MKKIGSSIIPSLSFEEKSDGSTDHASIILDSINNHTGSRITTFKMKLWKLLVGEFNTHRQLSRCSASSRAVSEKKLREKILDNPFLPFFWGKDQKGMQAREELCAEDIEECKKIILNHLFNAIETHEKLCEIGLHKQIANRYLEPWMETEIIWTTTETSNMRKLRVHEDAQPEFMLPCEESFHLLDMSTPQELQMGEWHIPLILPEEQNLEVRQKLMISAARCARASYFLPDGQLSSPEKDLELFKKLAGKDPKHLSPLEHQAQAVDVRDITHMYSEKEIKQLHGNFRGGWLQHRGFVEYGFFKV